MKNRLEEIYGRVDESCPQNKKDTHNRFKKCNVF